ncbi:Alpha/Beta hydrolase protein [Apiospora phragmitis]|uniref:Alpha/Beta hydrolase protein n=1 Tax=Apiospora phragmitis TaxID=2905665 RepID=A0ABR1VSX3_9PEZI
MSDTTQWPDDSVFEPFNISEETYKVVDGHEIQAAILVPKHLEPGTAHPIIINIHGGFLVTGGSGRARSCQRKCEFWVLHGDKDSAIHIRSSQVFVGLIKEKLPGTTVRFDVGKGEDHAFDLHPPSWEAHVPGALDFVRQSWLID